MREPRRPDALELLGNWLAAGAFLSLAVLGAVAAAAAWLAVTWVAGALAWWLSQVVA